MGFDPLSIGLAVGTAAIGASASRAQAEQNNAAIGRSQESLVRSTAAQQQQIADAAALEKRKLNLQSAQIEGRIRAATGGQSGSDLALIRQNSITLAENLGTVDINFKNQIERIQSGHEANATQLQAGLIDPGLATFTGGLGGFQTGLSIVTGLGQLSQLSRTPQPQQPEPFGPINIL